MNKWHLRFAITSNCNFNCKYCNTNNCFKPELRDKDIKEILMAVYNVGINRIHWTGGEPLIKKDLYKYIQYAKELGYIEQSITTNGFLLKKQAKDIIEAGIKRINVSLDTMNREKFKKITGKDGLREVVDGIYEALEMSDCQLKINMVVMKDNIKEINEFINFAKSINDRYGKNRIIIRFLQFFPCNPNQLKEDGQQYWKNEYVTEENIIEELRNNGNIITKMDKIVKGDNPTMKYYEVNESVIIGILAMFSWKYPCGNCFKLRITPYGYASCCLNDDEMYKVIDIPLGEKEKILKSVVVRRNTTIENRKNRKHYRKKLGEVRFGKGEKQMELDTFYDIIG